MQSKFICISKESKYEGGRKSSERQWYNNEYALLLSFANCPTQPDSAMLHCLRHRRTAAQLTDAHTRYREWNYINGGLGLGAAAPCVHANSPVVSSSQGNLRSPRGFPSSILSTAEGLNVLNAVPSVVGFNKDEGSLFLALFYERYLLPTGKKNNIFLYPFFPLKRYESSKAGT